MPPFSALVTRAAQGFQPEAARASYNFLFRIKSLLMPIYAYRCAACGHSRDVLQKISDPVLTSCPVCGADQFQKQVTAAGFQLKGPRGPGRRRWRRGDARGRSGARAVVRRRRQFVRRRRVGHERLVVVVRLPRRR
jgi:putative FmdB family regulatory protein